MLNDGLIIENMDLSHIHLAVHSTFSLTSAHHTLPHRLPRHLLDESSQFPRHGARGNGISHGELHDV